MVLRTNWRESPGLSDITLPGLVARVERGEQVSQLELLAGACELAAAHDPPPPGEPAGRSRLREETLLLSGRFISCARSAHSQADRAAFWLSPLPRHADPQVRNWQYLLEQGVPLAAAAHAAPAEFRAPLERMLEAVAEEEGTAVLLIGSREPSGTLTFRDRERQRAWALLVAAQFGPFLSDGPVAAAERLVVQVPGWVARSPKLAGLPAHTLVPGPYDPERSRAMLNLWPLPAPERSEMMLLWELAGSI